ncbi:MAG: DUF1016 N-terminal domain-containing protein [Polyangiaceae bacterium]
MKAKAAAPKATAQDRVAQFDEVVALIRDARREVGRAVDLHLIELYWKIGALLCRRIESDGWGKGTVSELAAYLARTQPGARGFSPPNLWRMRQFYETYQGTPKLAALTRELPWSSNLHIMSGAKSDEEREFYLRMAVEMRWNVREVARQIDAGAFERARTVSPTLVAEYRTVLPPKEVLRAKLHELYALATSESDRGNDIHKIEESGES